MASSIFILGKLNYNRTPLPFWNNFSIVNWMYQNGKNRLRRDKMRHFILFNCSFDDKHQNMGCSVSSLQNQRCRLVKQENVRLETRIDKLYNETAKLKHEIQNLVEENATAGVCMLINPFAVRSPHQSLLPICANRKLCNYWVKIVSVTCKEMNRIYFKLELLLVPGDHKSCPKHFPMTGVAPEYLR